MFDLNARLTITKTKLAKVAPIANQYNAYTVQKICDNELDAARENARNEKKKLPLASSFISSCLLRHGYEERDYEVANPNYDQYLRSQKTAVIKEAIALE